MMASEELAVISKKLERAVEESATNLFRDIVKAWPVDSGTSRAAWEIVKKGDLKWSISNNINYSPYLWTGRRKIGNKMQGSEQMADGGAPIVKRADMALQRTLNRIKG